MRELLITLFSKKDNPLLKKLHISSCSQQVIHIIYLAGLVVSKLVLCEGENAHYTLKHLINNKKR